jgi:hypothetical protein
MANKKRSVKHKVTASYMYHPALGIGTDVICPYGLICG